jgi:hypothetical protein
LNFALWITSVGGDRAERCANVRRRMAKDNCTQAVATAT